VPWLILFTWSQLFIAVAKVILYFYTLSSTLSCNTNVFFYLSMPYRDIWSFTFTGISDGYFLITAFYSPVYAIINLLLLWIPDFSEPVSWSVSWLSLSCRFSMKDSWRRRRKTDACIVLQGRQNNIRLSGIDMNWIAKCLSFDWRVESS